MKLYAALAILIVLSIPIASEASEERLFITATNGDVYTLKRLLDSGVDPNCYYADTGNTPLHRAAKAGHADAVAVLLEAGADPNVRNNKIITPLHYATEAGVNQAIFALLSVGADPNVPDINGNSALHQAVKQSNAEAVQALLASGSSLNAQNKNGQTPLHISARYGRAEHMEILLDYGADLSLTDRDGKVPLHHAVLAGDVETVSALLAKGSDPNARDFNGSTPLHSVALPYYAQGDPGGVIAVLLESGAEKDIKDKDGITAVQIAFSTDFARNGQVTAAFRASLLDPKCNGTPEGSGCWTETTNRPGCYVWDPYFMHNGTVTWSGECINNIGHGHGREVWTVGGELYSEGEGLLSSGKPHDEWKGRYYGEDASTWEGSYYLGRREGYWRVERADGTVKTEWY